MSDVQNTNVPIKHCTRISSFLFWKKRDSGWRSSKHYCQKTTNCKKLFRCFRNLIKLNEYLKPVFLTLYYLVLTEGHTYLNKPAPLFKYVWPFVTTGIKGSKVPNRGYDLDRLFVCVFKWTLGNFLEQWFWGMPTRNCIYKVLCRRAQGGT